MSSFSTQQSEPAPPETLCFPYQRTEQQLSTNRICSIMDPPNIIQGNDSIFPSSFIHFNYALNAGLLNPMPPPSPPARATPPVKIRSSHTLHDMMYSQSCCNPKTMISTPNSLISPQNSMRPSAGYNDMNECSSSDIKLNLSSNEGIAVSMNGHREILVGHSRFFATKLSDQWMEQQKALNLNLPYTVDIGDCDDVVVYIETLKLMYSKDLKKRLKEMDFATVLGILKVSVAIGFDAGTLSSLEHLEAAPWDEDEEERVALLLSDLNLEGHIDATKVLKRVSVKLPPRAIHSFENEEVLLNFLHVILEGTNEKAGREMKGLVSKLLRENSTHNDIRKESLYSACDGCLQLLCVYFLKAANGESEHMGEISRRADNLNWVLEILIDRQIGEEFLTTWASQTELSNAHSKIPAIHRYPVSKITARLFIGIGRGRILVSNEVRHLLLKTWLVPFYDDFGWLRRTSKGLDRHLIEDGLGNTILTLPLDWQQEILLSWFTRFSNSSEDCPSIQRAFAVWWRRSFWRRGDEPGRPQGLEDLEDILTTTVDNSM